MNLSMSTPSSSSTSASESGDPIADQFPAGLRVLVVDDDPAFLVILERMLRDCLYEVTKCERAEVALSLLRENTNGFDIVLCDVHMPDMDGFKLMEHIGSEMDLPVIMMSADDGKNVVMKGVTDGACDYLIKPVSIETLKNIWQHVVRKRKNQEQSGGVRLVWSVELHGKFMAAVNQLGIDEAVPQRILELMNVPGLTRANVASHLQKYRLYLRRLGEVSQRQGNLNNSFISPQESTFGATSINGFDLLASLQRDFIGAERRGREERGGIQIDIVFGS